MGVSLAAEFVGVLEEHAQEQRYAFAGPVRVELERQPDLDTGLFRIRVNTTVAERTAVPEPRREPAPPAAQPAPTPAPVPQPTAVPVSAPEPERPAPISEFPRRPEPLQVTLDVNGQRYAIRAPGAMLGRGSDCDIRIEDPGASRRHAEIRLVPIGRQVSIQIVDLGSTNGTRVDGERVDAAELHDGSKVTIGNTVMTVITDRR
jgi:hypothetical protein